MNNTLVPITTALKLDTRASFHGQTSTIATLLHASAWTIAPDFLRGGLRPIPIASVDEEFFNIRENVTLWCKFAPSRDCISPISRSYVGMAQYYNVLE